MDSKDNHNDAELQKVINILTPKFPPVMKRELTTHGKNRKKRLRILQLGGIAAMICVIATVALTLLSIKGNAVPAGQIIEQSLNGFSKSDSYKIDFRFRGKKTTDKEIYTPDTIADMIPGTLYLLNHEQTPLMRIDWHDTEKNTIIFNGKKYIHLKNGRIVKSVPHKPAKEISRLLSFEMLPKDIVNSEFTTITENNGIINLTVKSTHDRMYFIAEFSRTNKKLKKAIARYDRGNIPVDMIATDSINYSIPLSLELFMLENK